MREALASGEDGSARDLPRLPDSEHCHLPVIEVPSVEPHVVYLALKGIDYWSAEIHLFESLSTPEATWAEDVDFHELRSNDIKPDQEHPVLNQLWPEDFDNLKLAVTNLGCPFLAARVDIASEVTSLTQSAEGCITALVS
jgi:hypothetical protein